MLTTTGRSCFTSGASEGIWVTCCCLTLSAVGGGAATAAAWASAAKKEESDARRWQADTSGRATAAASAPVNNAAMRVKRRCMQPPKGRSPVGTAVAPLYFDDGPANTRIARPKKCLDRNLTPAAGSSSRFDFKVVSVRFGGSLQLVPRGPEILELHAPAAPIEDLDARSVQRIVEEPPLRVGEAARRERFVDLFHGKKPAPDPPREQGLAGLVRSSDLQRGHSGFPPQGNDLGAFTPLALRLGSRPFPLCWQGAGLGQDPPQLVALEHFILEQAGGHPPQRLAVVRDDVARPLHRLLHQPGDFLVDAALRALAVGLLGQAGHSLRPAEEGRTAPIGIGDGAQSLAHTVFGDHESRDLGRLLEIVRGAGGDAADHDLLGS